MTQERNVYVLLCAVVAVWGLNIVMIKYLSFFPPLLIAAIRMSVAGLALTPILLIHGNQLRLTPAQWLYVAGVALTSIALHQILMAFGVQHTTANNTSLILGLNPLATALLAALLLGEPLTGRKTLGIICGFGGVLLVVLSTATGGMDVQGWGDVLIFGSMMMYVIGGLLIRKATTRGVPVLVVTALSHLIASVMLWLAAVVFLPPSAFLEMDTRPFTWGVILCSGVIASGLGSLGWNWGIRQIGAARTSLFLNGMPLASLCFASLFLGEEMKWIHLLALALIVSGVYLGLQPQQAGLPLAKPMNSLK